MQTNDDTSKCNFTWKQMFKKHRNGLKINNGFVLMIFSFKMLLHLIFRPDQFVLLKVLEAKGLYQTQGHLMTMLELVQVLMGWYSQFVVKLVLVGLYNQFVQMQVLGGHVRARNNWLDGVGAVRCRRLHGSA